MSTIRGNGGRKTVVAINAEDGYAVSVARGLARFWSTLSPAARGPSGTRTGLAGYGVNGNRMTGYTPPLQQFHTAVRPVLTPMSRSLGAGVGVSGQAGLPNTAPSAPAGVAALALMSSGQMLGRAGLGG